MIAVDTNIFVYAHREDSPFHSRAKVCIESLANGKSTWAIPWPCVHEFFSIATHPRIYGPPTPFALAIDQIDAWFESPSLLMLAESPTYWPVLRNLVINVQIAGPQVHDARIAALCLHHGVQELWSADRDFGRFTGLLVRNPLVMVQ